MKRMIKVTALAVFGVVLAGSQAKAAPAGISVFHIHLVEMARQRGISIDEAARAALSWGITGVDLWFEQTEVELKESERLLAAGLKPASVVMIQDFVHTNDTALAERALAYAKRVGAKRIMLVPGFCKDGEDQATAWRALKPNLADFLKRAERDGIDVGLEDFDGAKVSVGSRAHLREAFAAFPSLGHVLDTGNYAFWKDDLLECVAEFRPRIRHVHVKDRDATNFWKSVAAGTGVLPVREALTDLVRGGYEGWLTIECFGSKDFWEDISLSAAFLARVCRNVAWTVPDDVPFKPITYVAHRGDYAQDMEATMPAYRRAVALGAEAVKLDVHPTKDGVPVLCHDRSLKRNMGWDVEIPDVTYAEIRKRTYWRSATALRTGNADLAFTDGEPSEERIVTLREALEVIRSVPRFWVDFKTFNTNFADRVFAEFKAAGIGPERIAVATFTVEALDYVRYAYPSVQRISHVSFAWTPKGLRPSYRWQRPLVRKHELVPSLVAYARDRGLDGVNLDVESFSDAIDAEVVAALKRNGLFVSLAVVNTRALALAYGGCRNDAVVTGRRETVKPIFDFNRNP